MVDYQNYHTYNLKMKRDVGRPRSKWHNSFKLQNIRTGLQNPVFGLEEEVIILSWFVRLHAFVFHIPSSFLFAFVSLDSDSSEEICSII
jgi:hypothetical protein